ncbi:MAG: zinc ABC transporter substrate-binding protein [Lachnospiraceae bacterium]|nr:zinc ABC transporter substrate-binding protein [Lachnospiraceae bacterium]
MKKILAMIIAAVMMTGLLSACGSTGAVSGAEKNVSNGEKKIQVVTTIFPEYDWVRNIVGEEEPHVEFTVLLDNGVDLHSYQPTAADILKISTCDIFIYVGGESDGWVDDALKEATNKDMKVINLLEVLGDSVKEEELVEGMEGEEEEEGEEGEEEEVEYDEHVWLSLRNVSVICDAITESLCEVDSVDADHYRANNAAYQKQLNELDAKYKEVVASAKYKTVLFGDRFPFRYMTDDYGLDYYAAFVGCSAETEASFETIVFLSKKTDELGLNTILTIETGDKKIAETIRDNTQNKDQQILTLDSMQSVTANDVKEGATYLSIMNNNLEVLKQALN